MIHFPRSTVAPALALIAFVTSAAGDTETPTLPPLEEVVGLVRANLAGATDESINRAAVEGFLRELDHRLHRGNGRHRPGRKDILRDCARKPWYRL